MPENTETPFTDDKNTCLDIRLKKLCILMHDNRLLNHCLLFFFTCLFFLFPLTPFLLQIRSRPGDAAKHNGVPRHNPLNTDSEMCVSVSLPGAQDFFSFRL
jgi:hypothetical protein